MRDERRVELIGKVEALLHEYSDLLAPDIEMPMVADWVLVCTHDSVADPAEGRAYRLNKMHQFAHRSVGLLKMALDDYKFERSDDDA